MEIENEIPSENESHTVFTTGQNANVELEANTNLSPNCREPSVSAENGSNEQDIRHDSTVENLVAMKMADENVQQVTRNRCSTPQASQQGSTTSNVNNVRSIIKPSCRDNESSSPKTPVRNQFPAPVSKIVHRSDSIDQVRPSSSLSLVNSSPEISRGAFTLNSDTLDSTPSANLANTLRKPSTPNSFNLQSPKELYGIRGSPCGQQYHSKPSTSNANNMNLFEFKTPEVFPSKQYYSSKTRNNLSCHSLPPFYQHSNAEFDPTDLPEANFGQHFLNNFNIETPVSLSERFQTLSDVQYPVSLRGNEGSRSNLSEPWQFHRKRNNDNSPTNRNQMNLERSSKRLHASFEQSFPLIEGRSGSSTFMVEDDDRLAEEDLLREMSLERPHSRTPQSFEQAFHFSQGTRGSTTPMVLDLHPDLNNLPRNIGSQSVCDEAEEDFMEE